MAVVRFLLYVIVGILFAAKISDWNLVISVVVINLFSDTFGSYSGSLVSPLIADIVGKKEFGEAEGFTSGVSEIINMIAQFVGSGLLLFMSYSNLAFVNAFTFLAAGLLYASVGWRHKKDGVEIERKEVNEKQFFATMKESLHQARKAQGLLTIVIIVALLNGALGAMSALVPIVMAGHKTTMLIGNYSFTMAVMGVVVSCGAALGSMFGPQLFKKFSAFTVTITAGVLSILTTISALTARIYFVLPFFCILAATASLGSIKLTQWLVNTVEHKILASTMGLLNTLGLASPPIMTTIFTSISGASNVGYALIVLIAVEAAVLFVTVKMSIKVKKTQVEIRTAATMND